MQRIQDSLNTSSLITEVRYQKNGGSIFTALSAISGLPDASGDTNYYLETVVDITELKRIQEQLRELAQTDKLTGLLNRRSGDLVINQAIHEATISNTPLCLLIGDIDSFKRINDLFGHPVGDRILISVAQKLSSTVRAGDHCIRWGGEEFIIVLPGCSLSVATNLAERIRSGVGALNDPEVGSVTISLGVGEWTKHESSKTLISRVDLALYKAKNSGRNRIEIAESE